MVKASADICWELKVSLIRTANYRKQDKRTYCKQKIWPQGTACGLWSGSSPVYRSKQISHAEGLLATSIIVSLNESYRSRECRRRRPAQIHVIEERVD